MGQLIEGVVKTPLTIIPTVGGKVMHAIRSDSVGYQGFAEAYFSTLEFGVIRAWKRHNQMTLNIVVPSGEVKFVLFDDRMGRDIYQEVKLSEQSYSRLTVPPRVWVGFQGLARHQSILMNLANVIHSPEEFDRLELTKIRYDWD